MNPENRKPGSARYLLPQVLMSFNLMIALLGASHAAASPAVELTPLMHELSPALNQLLGDLSSDARFNDPKNAKTIRKNAEKLASLAHELKATTLQAPGGDPMLGAIGSAFAYESGRAHRALAAGHREYAREILRGVTSYCIACHTRTIGFSGPAATAPAGLRPLESAEFWVATRQFDRALAEYAKVEPNNPFDRERALRSAMAIAIRVKRDPALALLGLDRELAKPNVPGYLRDQVEAWKATLKKWKAEPPRQGVVTEAKLLVEAKRLMADAKAAQKYPMDRFADALYLRASATLHELLELFPGGTSAPEALYLGGICSEVLDGLPLWRLHEYYYLACIDRAPHTPIARQCFDRYEERVYIGYSGSGGTEVPEDVLERLKELAKLARPLPKPAPRAQP